MNEYVEQNLNLTPEYTAQPVHRATANPNGTFSAGAAPAYHSQPVPQLNAGEKEKRIRHFQFFGVGSFLYALFYTLCLYHNASGITYPFFVGGTLSFFFFSLKKSGISAKKDSVFYVISLMLLGISTFCTDDGNIILINKLGIFILSFILMLHNFYTDDNWNFSAYLKNICRLIFGSIGTIGRPFSDLGLYLKSRKETERTGNSKGKYIFAGILISIPLMLIVIQLLCSADIVFDSLIEHLICDIQIPENFFGICFTMLFAFFAAYCINTYLIRRSIHDTITDKQTREPILAITVTSVLSAVYLIFSGIQVIYLFFGNMELPYGYTYARYAREGFFQLLFICFMNLILVLICLGRFREHKVLKAILTLISLCTYIMIASSAMRMIMYIQCYALTFLRIFVLWSLVAIFLLMTGVLVSIYKEQFPLFKYSMILVTALYLMLSFSHPDYWIAKYNLALYYSEQSSSQSNYSSHYDGRYLSHLSSDAAPVLLNDHTLSAFYDSAEHEENTRDGYHNWITEYAYRTNRHIDDIQTKGTKIRTFNISRFIAGKYIENADVY